MNVEKITFFNHGIKLAGTLFKPKCAQPCPVVVVVHQASGGEQTDPFYDHLKSELPKHGIAVLVFDRRGSGGSGGNFETADFDDLAGDVVSAVEFLESRPDIDKSRIGLHGTSQGAWIAPIVAVRKPEIEFIVAVSASWVTPAEQMDYRVAFHLKRDGFDHEGLYNNGVTSLGMGWQILRLPGLGDVNWGKFFAALTSVGYDYVVSIEHEDRAFEGDEELVKRGFHLSRDVLKPYFH